MEKNFFNFCFKTSKTLHVYLAFSKLFLNNGLFFTFFSSSSFILLKNSDQLWIEERRDIYSSDFCGVTLPTTARVESQI